jgi:hypothetical protein
VITASVANMGLSPFETTKVARKDMNGIAVTVKRKLNMNPSDGWRMRLT